MKSLVSIIIPVYNVEKFLDRCLTSVVNQTYENIEIILVDDGSPDNCPKLCDEWAKKDNRIKVIHKKNGGLSDARNKGLAKATGQYVLFIDSDDWVSINMVEKMTEAMENYDADMVICQFINIYPDGQMMRRKTKYGTQVFSAEEATELLLEDKQITNHVWRKLYKKELLPDNLFPVGLNYEDIYVMPDLFHACNKIVSIDEAYYYYLQNPNGIVRSMTKENILSRQQARQYSCSQIEKYFPDLKDKVEALRKRANNHIAAQIKIYASGHGHIITKIRYKLKKARKNFKAKMKVLRKELGIIKRALLLRGDKMFIVASPSYGNLGDQALLRGEEIFIDEQFPNYHIVYIPLIRTSKRLIRGLRLISKKRDIFALQAGGNIGTLYPGIHQCQEDAINLLRKKKLVIFPQTFYYSQDEIGKKALAKTKKIYNKCKHLIVAVREEKSYNFMKEEMPNVHVILTPDMALCIPVFRKNYKRSGVALYLRNDGERTLANDDFTYMVKELKKRFNKIDERETHVFHNLKKDEAKEELNKLWEQMAASELIITDRLHGMLFAALTETPCVVIPSKSHKILGCYEWVKHLNYIKLITNIKDLPSAITQVLSIKKPRYYLKDGQAKFQALADEMKREFK